MGLYRQMIGRVLRPAEGKPDAIFSIIPAPCSGTASSRIRVDWTLDPDRRAAKSDASTTVRTDIVAPARMHAMRRRPRRRRAVFALRISAAAPPRQCRLLDGDLGLVGRNAPRQ